jgi:tRNA1Val (adenine37-N6)-methyltransferase
MPNDYFSFKQFTIHQERCTLRVSTDSCILGAWFAAKSLKASTILDIGSGTGLLMMMLAQKFQCLIYGIEIDHSCYTQLKENISRSPWSSNCIAIEADVREFTFNSQYDLIISNPPFHENQLQADDNKKNMAKHSSHLNLTELISVVGKWLAPEGRFGVLLPFSRIREAEDLATKSGLYCTERLLVKQTPAHDYFRGILQFERRIDVEPLIYTMVIKDTPHTYSDIFTNLMKDYYLKL